MTIENAGGVEAPTSEPILGTRCRSERSLCGPDARPELESTALRVRREKGSPRPRRRVRKRRLAALSGRPPRRGGPRVHVRARARRRERDPSSRPGCTALGRRHRDLRGERTERVRGPARRRAASSSKTEEIAPIMRQAIITRSRISVSTSTTAWTSAASPGLSGRTSASRASSRAGSTITRTVRQERLHPEREDDRTQGARGRAGLAARAGLDEGPDPHGVPEHHLLRTQHVWGPAGGPRLLPEGPLGA